MDKNACTALSKSDQAQKTFGVVSTNRGKRVYLAFVPWTLLSPYAMRGVWKPTRQHNPTPGHNAAGSGASRSPKYPVSADHNSCGLQLLIKVREDLPSPAAGSGGDKGKTDWFPGGMKYTFYLTHLAVSTQSTNAIQLFPTASFHPSPLPTSPWATPAAPRSGFHAGRALQPPSPHLISTAGWLTPSKTWCQPWI